MKGHAQVPFPFIAIGLRATLRRARQNLCGLWGYGNQFLGVGKRHPRRLEVIHGLTQSIDPSHFADGSALQKDRNRGSLIGLA